MKKTLNTYTLQYLIDSKKDFVSDLEGHLASRTYGSLGTYDNDIGGENMKLFLPIVSKKAKKDIERILKKSNKYIMKHQHTLLTYQLKQISKKKAVVYDKVDKKYYPRLQDFDYVSTEDDVFYKTPAKAREIYEKEKEKYIAKINRQLTKLKQAA